MKLSTRALVTLTVFGTLWGLVEISVGSVLKSLNVPLSGVILSSIGLFLVLLARSMVAQPGSTLFIGAIAMLLKLFSLGGVIIGPMVGILTETLIAELVLTIFRSPGRTAFTLAGAGGVLWVLVQPLITNPLLFGRTMLTAWAELVERGSRMVGLPANAVLVIVGILVAMHLVIGGFIGWQAWNLSEMVKARLGRPLAATPNPSVEK